MTIYIIIYLYYIYAYKNNNTNCILNVQGNKWPWMSSDLRRFVALQEVPGHNWRSCQSSCDSCCSFQAPEEPSFGAAFGFLMFSFYPYLSLFYPYFMLFFLWLFLNLFLISGSQLQIASTCRALFYWTCRARCCCSGGPSALLAGDDCKLALGEGTPGVAGLRVTTLAHRNWKQNHAPVHGKNMPQWWTDPN